MGEKERATQRQTERERSYLYVILWLSAFGHVGRHRGIKSWEVQLKGNEAEQNAVARKTIQHDRDGTSTGLCAAVLLCKGAHRCLTRG